MKKICVLVMYFLLISISGVSAQVELPKHSFEIGTEISHIKYEEPDLMEEEGMMYGLTGSYVYHNNAMLAIEAKGSIGEVDYDGSLWDGTLVTKEGITDYMWEFRGLTGYDFPIFETSVVTPYGGFGYRYLNDDLSYERESNYFYSPIGVKIITELEGWSFGLAFEYDCFWFGVQESHLNDINVNYNDVENNQDSGYGLRGSLRIVKNTEKIDFLIEPYIRYWNIDKSDESTYTSAGATGCEPDNNSTEIGGKIAVKF